MDVAPYATAAGQDGEELRLTPAFDIRSARKHGALRWNERGRPGPRVGAGSPTDEAAMTAMTAMRKETRAGEPSPQVAAWSVLATVVRSRSADSFSQAGALAVP
ncbi:hypothetical protein GCM10010272_32430 [Streptomyces lateritius]|nr:hypothetical protein GCM10010272_32430 [Streptomyces lateritius]